MRSEGRGSGRSLPPDRDAIACSHTRRSCSETPIRWECFPRAWARCRSSCSGNGSTREIGISAGWLHRPCSAPFGPPCPRSSASARARPLRFPCPCHGLQPRTSGLPRPSPGAFRAPTCPGQGPYPGPRIQPPQRRSPPVRTLPRCPARLPAALKTRPPSWRLPRSIHTSRRTSTFSHESAPNAGSGIDEDPGAAENAQRRNLLSTPFFDRFLDPSVLCPGRFPARALPHSSLFSLVSNLSPVGLHPFCAGESIVRCPRRTSESRRSRAEHASCSCARASSRCTLNRAHSAPLRRFRPLRKALNDVGGVGMRTDGEGGE